MEQDHEFLERGFDHRLWVARHERVLLIVFHLFDGVLNLLRTNILILAEPQGMNHLAAEPSRHCPFAVARSCQVHASLDERHWILPEMRSD